MLWFNRKRREQERIIRETLPQMYEELEAKHRAILYMLMKKNILSPVECTAIMVIMDLDDFRIWMEKQPKLEAFKLSEETHNAEESVGSGDITSVGNNSD